VTAVAASGPVERLAAALGPAVERRETHGSWVLLAGDRAYKVKKPVVMDFLDYGSLERRRAMCREEVAVNRRAAPDLYLGVCAIVEEGDAVALAPEDSPGALEYAVEMRRFAEADTLAARLEQGRVAAAEAAAVGRHVAAFHAACPAVRDGSGAEAVKRSLDDDFATLLTLAAGRPDRVARLLAAERFTDGFLAARWDELDARARAGRVRDAHGDLRLEHVVMGREIALVDAIEFDPRLRRIDAGLDLAFLVMELHAAGRSDLARTLVSAYREAGGDPGDDALIACFAAYRARVRAKVALLREHQMASGEAAGAVDRQADRLLELGDRLVWLARRPLIVAVAGVAATGKTTLAAALAERAGVAHFSSDAVRKRLLGLAPTARAPESAYATAMSERTYRALGARAAGAGSAVVDATFHRRALRDAFHGSLGGADVLFVECRAPLPELERRLAAREREPDRTSDATLAVLRRQVAQGEPFDEVAPRDHLLLRSDRPVEELVEAVADALDARRRPAQAPVETPSRTPMP
jgi:aminoglycoside phosphotransferase family enzyme/predicted kinase